LWSLYSCFLCVCVCGTGVWTCKAGTLLLEPHLQSILLQLFWR
jgi:hypothetical protein